jgi:hypothetical protein
MVEEVRMISIALNSLWHFIYSSASVATLIGYGAAAVAVLLPKQLDFITDLRKWAIVVAVIAFSYTSVAGKFYNVGLAVKQAQWDAALVREAKDGDKILKDAERDSRADTPDSLRNDSWNRDNWNDETKR